jgi:hypothetical protein
MFARHTATRRRSGMLVNCRALSPRAASESGRSPTAISRSRTRCLIRTRSCKPRSAGRFCHPDEVPSTAINSRGATSQVAFLLPPRNGCRRAPHAADSDSRERARAQIGSPCPRRKEKRPAGRRWTPGRIGVMMLSHDRLTPPGMSGGAEGEGPRPTSFPGWVGGAGGQDLRGEGELV